VEIKNVYSGIDTKGLNKISPEINYLKDEFIKKKKEQYDCFKLLLEKNRKIKKKEDRLTYGEIARLSGICRPTYYRLRKELETKDWKGIERRSTRPRNVRQSKIPKETIDLILKIRLGNMTYGKSKLKIILERDYSIRLSSTTINKILNKLKLQSKIPKYSPSQTLKKRHRRFNDGKTYAQKWDYNKHCICNKDKTSLDKISIGELVQIDHMTVTKNNVVMKQFTAIDHITRVIVSEVYSNATSHTAMKFLKEKVLDVKEGGFPFEGMSIQTDGGSEFMRYVEDACREYNIPLYILPPSRPKYNGRVERSNRIMREEFYARKDILEDSVGGFKYKLKEFVDRYNSYRPHKELDYLTPLEYYNGRMKKAG
jgi:transposase InsO family protein